MEKSRIVSRSFIALCFLVTVFIASNHAEAGARRFTYVCNQATTSAPGTREFEQWITWDRSPREDRRFNEVDLREEIEFGVTEHFQIGLYLANWGYREDPAEHEHGFSYQTSALELIYNLTNPTTDLLGLALDGEILGGPEELELESKVILQKNLGRFVVAYNATLEAKWEGDRLGRKRWRTRAVVWCELRNIPSVARRGGVSARDRYPRLVGGRGFDSLCRA